MPVTPFHLIAAVPLKSITKKKFSWTVFALANVFIDTEVIYFVLTTGIPSHKIFHTVMGATIIAILCATLGKYLCQLGLKILNLIIPKKIIIFETVISFKTAWISAFIGAYSHILLDSFVNIDMRPLYPFSDSNQLLGLLSLNFLYLLCIFLFLIGIVIAFINYLKK